MTEYRSETYKTLEHVEEVEEVLRTKESEEESRVECLGQEGNTDQPKEVVEMKKTVSWQTTDEHLITMEINQKKNELHLYPVNDNEYIGAIDLDTTASFAMNQPRTVFVLDASESMGAATERFVKDIFPLVMSKLNYEDDHLIDLISFGKESVHTVAHSNEDFVLTNSKLKGEGGTSFGPAIEKLRLRLEHFQRFSSERLIRVLAISSGKMEDHSNVEREIKKLTDFLATSELTINSQAVRLFTSDKQPDTKALAYLLQINNTTETDVCDIKATESDESIANAIVALFKSDGFERNQSLEFEESIFLKFPWNNLQSTRMTLVPGWNSFWLKLVPTGSIKLDDSSIKVIIEHPLTLAAFHQLMETKLGYIADHMTILKIVGSPEAIAIADKISEYFKNTEDVLALKSPTTNKKIITNWLDGIAKNKTNISDSAQMADFIRMTNRRIERHRQREKEARESELRRKTEELDARREIEAETLERLNQENQREMEERIKREVAERVQREVQERVMKENQERLKLEEIARRKRLEKERIQRLEDERVQRLQHERINREKEGVKRTELEENKRVDRLEQERVQQEERERIRLEKEELFNPNPKTMWSTSAPRRHSLQVVAGKKQMQSNSAPKRHSIQIVARNSPTVDSESFQTIFIVDDRQAETKMSRRVTAKAIPLMLTKLFTENPQLTVHLLTFIRHKTNVEEMLRSLEQSLDGKMGVRILVFTDGATRKHQHIEDLCETLSDFLNESNYLFELEVVRVTSNTKYKLIDIDAGESNEFIAKQDPMQSYTMESYCSFHFLIFLFIFTLLFVRYIYNFVF